MAQNVGTYREARTTAPSIDGSAYPQIATSQVARDRARWGPVWAGFVATVSTFVLMEMFVLWVGWVTVSINASGVATSGREWITWIIAVIAFFIGGLVASLTTPLRGTIATAMDGFLVWALTTVVMVAGSVAGGGLLFGSLGGTLAQLSVVTAGRGSHAVMVGLASDIQTAAFWGFITLITTAAAAILGGWLGDMTGPIGYFSQNETTNRTA